MVEVSFAEHLVGQSISPAVSNSSPLDALVAQRMATRESDLALELTGDLGEHVTQSPHHVEEVS